MTDGGTRPQVGARTEPATLPIPVQSAARRRRRGRRPLVVVLVVVVVLAVLAAIAYPIGERAFRRSAEAQIEQQVDASLPAGVTGTVHARIEGASSALLQYLRGSFDDVTLTSERLEVAGAPSSAVVHLAGVPVRGGRIERATARIVVGQAAFRDIPALRDAGGSAPRLGDGTVSTTLTRNVLGLDLKIAVVLKPSLTGQTVRLRPSAATIKAGPAAIPATAIVQQLLPDGVAVCAANYLPRGVAVTSLAVRRREAVVGVSAKDVDLASLDTASTGSCG